MTLRSVSLRDRREVIWRLSEVLLSATLSFAVMAVMIFSSIYWSARFNGLVIGINTTLHRSLEADFGIGLAVLVCSLVATVAVYAVLRVSSILPFAAKLRPAGGAVAVILPAACFWSIWYFNPSLLLYAKAYLRWLPAEVFVALLCVLLYSLRRWPISSFTSLFLLALHNLVWYRVYAQTFSGGFSELVAVPILAFGAALGWGWYFRLGS